MANGGFRPGAGRKKAPHTLAAEKAREYVITRVTSELDPIVTGQIEAAKGLWYEDIKDGKKRIYQQKPDIVAAKNLLDQTIGKAKETVEVQQYDLFDDEKDSL